MLQPHLLLLSLFLSLPPPPPPCLTEKEDHKDEQDGIVDGGPHWFDGSEDAHA